MNVKKQFKVFIASPGDVLLEREIVPKIITEINLIISAIAPEKGILLDLVRWETNVFPGLGIDAQDVVNQQLPDYDIFVGIMWQRFGTPTARAGSGTEEEYLRAFGKWKNNNKFPVLFYFSQKNISLPDSSLALEQLQRLVKFKEELQSKGLVWNYNSPEEFGDILRLHLIMVLGKLAGDSGTESVSGGNVTSDSGVMLIRQRVIELGREYEKLRETMPAGGSRTTKMSIVESKMRTMASEITPILTELTASPSPGDRLAAIATLKELPANGYLNWLANRVGQAESSFIGFQASLALLNAVQRIGGKSVLSAIENALLNINASSYKDPNQIKVLTGALEDAQKLKGKK